MKEVDEDVLWDKAVEHVTRQQEEAFDGLVDRAIEKHLEGECADCEDGLSTHCESRIVEGIERWQDEQFDTQAEREYERLVELEEERALSQRL